MRRGGERFLVMGIVGEFFGTKQAEMITSKRLCELESKLSEHALSLVRTDRGVGVDEKRLVFLCYEFLTGAEIAKRVKECAWFKTLLEKYSFEEYYQEWYTSKSKDRFWLVNFRDCLDEKPWGIFATLSQQTGLPACILNRVYHCLSRVSFNDADLIAKALQLDVAKLGLVKKLSEEEKQELRKYHGLWFLCRLKDLMQKAKISSEKLAKMVLLKGSSTISDIAGLRATTTLHTMRKIARALGVSLEQLQPIRKITTFKKGQRQLNLK